MKVVIAGDSWSQGEWAMYNGEYKNSHRGLEKYLLDAGHNVVNVGRGGNTNNQSLELLENELVSYTYDYCIFFFTDALRQISQDELLRDEPYTIIQSHIKYVVDKLNYLVDKFQFKLIVVGGNAEFNPIDKLNSTYIVTNMISLLDLNFIKLPFSQSAEWVNLLSACSEDLALSIEQKKQWSEIISSTSKILDQRKNSSWFADGNHPDRNAHRVLFDHLVAVINLH